jgi:hypothetical protein
LKFAFGHPLTLKKQKPSFLEATRSPDFMRHILLISLLSFAGSAFAATRDISDFAEPSGKYLAVSKQLSVSEGDTLLVASGLNILFAPLTGITVSGGTFIVRGTKDMPVTLTSINDTSGTGTPFDWNGIEVASEGSVRLSFCYIGHATSGITAPDSQSVTLDQCIFSDNGQWALSIAGVIATVPDRKPFSYGSLPEVPGVGESVTLSRDSVAALPPVPVPLVDTSTPRRSSLKRSNIIFGAVGLVLAAGGGYCLYRGSQAKSEYNAYVPGNPSFEAATPSQRQDTFSDLRQESNLFTALGWAFVGLAAADGVFIVWRVAF